MSPSDNVEVWLKEQLSSVLSFSVPQDLIEYIMKIENERDIDDYLRTLLDFNNPTHKQLCENFKVMRCGSSKKPESRPGKNDNSSKDLSPNCFVFSEQGKKKAGNDGQKKKKEKFVNLYTADGEARDSVMLKGRHRCDCQSFKHRLVNNCLKCGRIVCTQEGSGPCLFCGSLVCSKEELEFINAKTEQSKKLYKNLMEVGRPEGWEDAVAHRDRLLEYDRTTQRRTKVIDDEGEYFSIGSVWLSQSEKEKLEKKENAERERKHASRLHKKFTIDFAGRQLAEDEAPTHEPDEESWVEAVSREESVVHPDITDEWKPTFLSSGEQLGKKLEGSKFKTTQQPKVQDKELLEMSDMGVCLSLHQPWASLLAHGIMRHEGRTWYSSHRGRLWIAAAAKEPTDAEITQTEAYFRLLRANENVEFPKHYPVSCLLGCVSVVDCLPQEEYQARYQNRESESPFVFICEDAQPLSLKLPISGQHKIYKLDKQIHKTAQKMLLRNMRQSAEE